MPRKISCLSDVQCMYFTYMLQKAFKESKAMISVAVTLRDFFMVLGHVYICFPHCSSGNLSHRGVVNSISHE